MFRYDSAKLIFGPKLLWNFGELSSSSGTLYHDRRDSAKFLGFTQYPWTQIFFFEFWVWFIE